jgi:hypothetical protein
VVEGLFAKKENRKGFFRREHRERGFLIEKEEG